VLIVMRLWWEQAQTETLQMCSMDFPLVQLGSTLEAATHAVSSDVPSIFGDRGEKEYSACGPHHWAETAGRGSGARSSGGLLPPLLPPSSPAQSS
jgi:hypothetical protein